MKPLLAEKLVTQLMAEWKVIDVHVHIGASLGLIESQTGVPFKGSEEDLIRIMNLNGIDKAVISPIPGYPRPKGLKNTQDMNNMVANAISRYPERFPCGLGVIEPLYGEECVEEVHRIFKDLKLKGIMLHTRYQGIELDHPIVFKIFDEAAKYKPIALVHVNGINEEPWRLARLAETFSEITFIAGHPAIDIADLAHILWLCKKFDNIYLDTCIWHVHNFPYRNAVKAIGAERIVFGDDIPYIDISYDLIHVKLAEISDEEKEKILWQNAAKLFDITL